MKRTALILSLLTLFAIPMFADAKMDTALSTIGTLGASSMYMTYVSIGSISDGYEKKVYEADTAKALIDEIQVFSKNAKKSLQALIDDGVVGSDDEEFIDKMKETFDFMILEAGAMNKYIENGDKPSAIEFQKYRKKAWANIKELLKLED